MYNRGKTRSARTKEKIKPGIRFKQLARGALMNQQWLSGLIKQQNANISSFHPKVTGILTNSEKSLLRKSRELRSNSERLILVKLMANLTVFSRLPPKLRARLSPYAYFIIIGPKRRIIKEGHEPATVYFVLTGDITVSKKVWDSAKAKYVDGLDHVSGPGEWLGDIDLLENEKRQYTFTSKTEVELLALDREDFESILMPFVRETWEGKKAILRHFGYFDFFTNQQLVTACKIATLQQFEPYETIYHQDKGLESFVHFVISGTCMILQCLKIKVSIKRGRKHFELVEVTKSEDLFKKPSATEIRSYVREKTTYSTFSLDDTKSVSDEDILAKEQRNMKKIMNIQTIERECQMYNPAGRSSGSSKIDYKSSIGSSFMADEEKNIKNVEEEEESVNDYDSDLDEISEDSVKRIIDEKYLGTQSESRIENHFIEVCRVSKGGIFGLGETMEHRIIMTETTVQCLVLPKYWLLEREQNPGNMWEKHRIQLDFTLPSRENLFKNFLNSRKWQVFKSEIVSSFKSPGTKLQDIPIIYRIISSDE
ncbi:uncharacterized protein LOC128871896 [Anastrepha ludens]|uniref:uncharacterized protein LOC128871896 n=1 Tax=Anastrepha ludens TaxID=28586 RepID=UPI0023AE6ED8|nr:uncharacterized protein LOC128871896 [Anastrepha ludens]